MFVSLNSRLDCNKEEKTKKTNRLETEAHIDRVGYTETKTETVNLGFSLFGLTNLVSPGSFTLLGLVFPPPSDQGTTQIN